MCQTRMVLELTNIRIKKDGITRIVNALPEAELTVGLPDVSSQNIRRKKCSVDSASLRE